MAKLSKLVEFRLPARLAVQLYWLTPGGSETVPPWLEHVVRDYMFQSGVSQGSTLAFSSIQTIDEDEGEYRLTVRFVPAEPYQEATVKGRQAAQQLLVHSVSHFSRNPGKVDEYYSLSPSERMAYLIDVSNVSTWSIDRRKLAPSRRHGIGRIVRVTPGEPLAPHLRRAV